MCVPLKNKQDLDSKPNTRRWLNVGFMLSHRLRRWPNVEQT